MNMPMECIICPVTNKEECFECWKKKVLAGEIILTPEERRIFNRDNAGFKEVKENESTNCGTEQANV